MSPTVGRKPRSEKNHKINRDKQTAITTQSIGQELALHEIFEKLAKGRSRASIAKEMNISVKKFSEMLRSAYAELRVENLDVKQEVLETTHLQLDFLIEKGLGLLETTLEPAAMAGLWKMIASTFMELAAMRLELFGGPAAPAAGENGLSPGTINIMNVGTITPTITNTPGNALMQAADDPEFLHKAFNQKHEKILAEYLHEMSEDADAVVITSEDLQRVENRLDAASNVTADDPDDD